METQEIQWFRVSESALIEQGVVQREWIGNHYEYAVIQAVEEDGKDHHPSGQDAGEMAVDRFSKEEEEAERIREHLEQKHLLSGETAGTYLTGTAAAG